MLRKRHIAAIGLGLLLATAAVEAILQAGAMVMWWRRAGPSRPPGPVVLCVGDSLTFGLGAGSPEAAYPAQLEAILRRRGHAVSVVSGGLPGQSSADLLQRLPDQLADLRPDVVCILVGWNDLWARPMPVDPATLVGTGGFPFRWRTGRLLALLGADLHRHLEDRSAVELPFLGAWHAAGHDFYFAPDGWALLGGARVGWAVDDDRLVLTRADGAVVPLRWQLSVAGELRFAIPGWKRFERARRGRSDDRSRLDAAEDLLLAGREREAAALLDLELSGPSAAAARALRVRICHAAGGAAEARQHVEALRTLYGDRPDAEVGAALATALQCVGAGHEAAAVALEVVRRDPERVAAWQVLVETAADPSARHALHADLQCVLQRPLPPWTQVLLRLEQAVAVAPVDAGAAMAALAAAAAQGAGQDELLLALRRARVAGASSTALEAAIDRLDEPPERLAALHRDLRRATSGDDQVFAVLTAHLHASVAICAGAGADTLLLGYPFRLPRHEAAVAEVAEKQRLPMVVMAARFGRELERLPHSHWFVDDIHCTDHGYALMAELVADALPARRNR